MRAREKVLSGAEPVTTNNRMELMAAIEALALHRRRQPDSTDDRLRVPASGRHQLGEALEAERLAHGVPSNR